MECVLNHVEEALSFGSINNTTDTLQCSLSMTNMLQLLSSEKSTSLSDILASMNSALNSSRNRLEGLVLLQNVLKQCHTKVFQENANTWLKLLVAILQTYDPPQNLRVTCVVLCQLIRIVRQFPELSRDFHSDLLPTLMTALLAAKQEWQSEAVMCLSQCMKSYPGPCGPYKNKIELLTLGLLETNDLTLCKRVCQCYTLLTRTGGGGNQGVKHTEAWSQHIHKMMNSLGDTLDTMYACVDLGDDPVTSDIHEKSVQFPGQLSDSCDVKVRQLANRYTVLTTMISNMLTQEFPAMVRVPVRKSLALVQKTLAVTPKYLLSRPTQERIALTTVLPSVCIQALQMLQSLVNSVSSNLVPYCQAVNRSLLQVLKATDTPRQYGVVSPYSVVRCRVWDCLSVWLSKLGLSSGIEAVVDELMIQIRRDFVPVGGALKLESRQSKKLGEVSDHFHHSVASKKKQKKSLAHTADLGLQKKLDPSADTNTCTAALKVLTAIFETAGPLLQPDIYKVFTHSAVSILTKCAPGAGLACPLPYTQPECRLGLYTALLASVQSPHVTLAPPLQYVVNVYRAGMHDRSLQVSSFCRQATLGLETIIHPRAASMNFPVPPVHTADRTGSGHGLHTEENLSTMRNIAGLGSVNLPFGSDMGKVNEEDSTIEKKGDGPPLRTEGNIDRFTIKMDGISKQMDGISKNMDGISKNIDGPGNIEGSVDLGGNDSEASNGSVGSHGSQEKTGFEESGGGHMARVGGQGALCGEVLSTDLPKLGKRKLEEGPTELADVKQEYSARKIQALESAVEDCRDSGESPVQEDTNFMLQDFVDADPDSE